jgi:hypothetical protein
MESSECNTCMTIFRPSMLLCATQSAFHASFGFNRFRKMWLEAVLVAPEPAMVKLLEGRTDM